MVPIYQPWPGLLQRSRVSRLLQRFLCFPDSRPATSTFRNTARSLAGKVEFGLPFPECIRPPAWDSGSGPPHMNHNKTANDRLPAAFAGSPADRNCCNISYNIPNKIIGFYLPDKRLCCEFTANCVLSVVCCVLWVVRKQRAVKALSWKAGRLGGWKADKLQARRLYARHLIPSTTFFFFPNSAFQQR